MSHPVLDEIARRAERRPIYLACAPAVAPWATDEIAEVLCRTRPGMTIVNGCGLYGSKAAWRTRWPEERERYGGIIVLTAAKPLVEGEPATGGGILGGHILGEYGLQELTDLVELGRAIAWLACFGGQRRLVSRFSVGRPPSFRTGHWARLFRSADAEPFVPVVGNLSPFVLVRI